MSARGTRPSTAAVVARLGGLCTAGLMLFGSTACSSSGSSTPTASTALSGSSSSPTNSGSIGASDAGQATASATTSSVDAVPTVTPAPSTAGTLNASSLPSISGFSSKIGDGDDGSYVPNGTAQHAIPNQQAVENAMSQRCGDVPGQLPTPTAVLSGSYMGASGEPGSSTVYTFSTPVQAQQFARTYAAGLRTCLAKDSNPMTVTLTQGLPALINTRFYPDDNSRWTEVMKVVDNRVDEVMLQNTKGTFTLAMARALVASMK